jgi:hypothetical protein
VASAGQIGGNGGPGITSTITGSSVGRAGGGGGGGNTTAGTGVDGGGSGGKTTVNGTSGTVNSGGGGGGTIAGPSGNYSGGAGGSGIVILKFPATYNITASAGVTISSQVLAGYRVTSIIGGTGTVSFS